MTYDAPRVVPAGDAAMLVEFADTIEPAAHDRVRALARALEAARPRQ